MVQRGKLIPLIKMIKAWNAVHGKKLRSYHLEALVLKVFTNCPIGEYGLAVKEFFEKSPQHLDYLPDPSGASGNVGYYLDFVAMHQALDILKEAHNRALRANCLDDFGKTDQAFGEWRAIFGDYFPHYAERRVYGNPALVV